MSGTAFNTTDVLVVGVGGQGVLTASEIMAEAAIAIGHDVKKTEVAGMAQRGGVVSSHLRFGPRVMAPAIAPGTADVMLAFEAAEALRWAGYVRPEGLLVVNTQRVIPPVVSNGLYAYPDNPIDQLRQTVRNLVAIDADAIAIAAGGTSRLANTVMLGAIADHLPFGAEILRQCTLRRFAKRAELAEANARAFEAGRQAGSEMRLKLAASA